MVKMRCIARAALLAVIMAAAALSCAKDERTFTLKMCTQLNDSSPMVEGFRAWAKAVEARTEGGLKIQMFTSATMGNDEDIIEQALLGVNVAVLTDGGRIANYVREIGIIGMPYIAEDYDELRRITESPTFTAWDAELTQKGMRILSYNWYDGPRSFYTNKVVNTPADLSGQRIRTPGAPVWAKSVAALGATPVAMPWPDSYNALSSGSIDGVEVQATSAWPARLYEVLSHISKTEHFQLANFIMVGEVWFQRLPDNYKRILMEECKKASYENAKQILAIAAKNEGLMAEKGMKINEVDKDAFVKASERAYVELNYRDLRDQIWREIGK